RAIDAFCNHNGHSDAKPGDRERAQIIRIDRQHLLAQTQTFFRLLTAITSMDNKQRLRSERQMLDLDISLGRGVQTANFRRAQTNLERPGNARDDLILQLKTINEFGVELLGPEVSAAPNVDQSRVDPQCLAARLRAPFEDVTHTEISADLLE